MTTYLETIATSTVDHLDRVFWRQVSAYSPATAPTYAQRMDRLQRIEKLLQRHYRELVDTLQADFGYRGRDEILAADIASVMPHLFDVRRNLRRWMRPQRRSSGPLGLTGARSWIVNEPLGVVGVMSPFSAPINLSLSPAIDAIAGGNRVMIKTSELAPRTGAMFAELVDRYFDATELAVVTGGADISAHFVSLPWDKFIFIGATETGKHVLAAAAPNLTPVILELGGKNPAVVLPDADIRSSAEKVAQARLTNAGQTCTAVDYAIVPEEHLDAFIAGVLAKNNADFPTVQGNQDYSSMIDWKSYQRVLDMIAEARDYGFRVIQPDIYNNERISTDTGQIPLTIVVNPDERLRLHREEVFGPILSIYTYRDLDSAISIVNAKRKPLALYIFGHKRRDIDHVVNRTSSGGVSINDLALRAMSTSMGFGGVAHSGMGRYKGGRVGFEAFTNQKAVFRQSRLLSRFTSQAMPPFRSAKPRNAMLKMARLPQDGQAKQEPGHAS
jgi:coniferyl-aldehyde dehydrogenase